MNAGRAIIFSSMFQRRLIKCRCCFTRRRGKRHMKTIARNRYAGAKFNREQISTTGMAVSDGGLV